MDHASTEPYPLRRFNHDEPFHMAQSGICIAKCEGANTRKGRRKSEMLRFSAEKSSTGIRSWVPTHFRERRERDE